MVEKYKNFYTGKSYGMGCFSSKNLIIENTEQSLITERSTSEGLEEANSLTSLIDIATMKCLEDILIALSRVLEDKVVKIASIYRSPNGTTRTIQTITRNESLDGNVKTLETLSVQAMIKTNISDLITRNDKGTYLIHIIMRGSDTEKSVVTRLVRSIARKIIDNGYNPAVTNSTIVAIMCQDSHNKAILSIVWRSPGWEDAIGRSVEFWGDLDVLPGAFTASLGPAATEAMVERVFDDEGTTMPMMRRSKEQGEFALTVQILPMMNEAEIRILACQVHAVLKMDTEDIQGRKDREIGSLKELTLDTIETDSLFDSLHIGTLIGKGGYGSVYRAVWDGKTVALKVLDGSEHLLADSMNICQSAPSKTVGGNEIEVGKKLKHRNVIRTIDHATRTIEGREQTWIVLEFCESGSLRQLVEDGYFASAKEVVRIARDIATGMAYLHSQQILHGDLSSNNVLFDKEYTAKISDFGLSRDFGGVTVVTSALGTTSYMAPELLSSGKLNKAGDVYSYGILLLEMLTGKRAFSGMRYVEVITRKLGDDSDLLLNNIPDNAPQTLRLLIQDCIQTEYSTRPSFDTIVRTFDQEI